MTEPSMPADAEYVRTTPTFTQESVPAGLLAEHRVAPGAWAVLRVLSGSLRFEFDDAADAAITVHAGDRRTIPPDRPHHLTIDGPVSFEIDFYRRPG